MKKKNKKDIRKEITLKQISDLAKSIAKGKNVEKVEINVKFEDNSRISCREEPYNYEFFDSEPE